MKSSLENTEAVDSQRVDLMDSDAQLHKTQKLKSELKLSELVPLYSIRMSQIMMIKSINISLQCIKVE